MKILIVTKTFHEFMKYSTENNILSIPDFIKKIRDLINQKSNCDICQSITFRENIMNNRIEFIFYMIDEYIGDGRWDFLSSLNITEKDLCD